MGSKNTKTESLHYEAKEWQEIEKSSLYEVMRNTKGQQAHLYHFDIKSERNLTEEADIYHRRRSTANWVQVLGANLQKSGFGFCGTQQSACVLTERIPFLLNSVQRLNKQQSLVVLYNALRGYNDISKIIVPETITDKMIGFNKQGQTKVWINQNFGMNYPAYYHADAKLNQSQLISNLLNAVSPRCQLAPDFVNALRNAGTIDNSLQFIRNHGGVAENVLQSNRINVYGNVGSGKVDILRENTQVVPNVATINFVQPQYVAPQFIGYNQQPATQTHFRSTPGQYMYGPQVSASSMIGQSSYIQPNYSGRLVEPYGASKYSFTAQ